LTKRFANPYVALGIDAVFSIFWVSALAAVQVWTASGVPASSTGYCNNFAYGDQDKCVISYGTVIIGVLIFVLFFVATALSGLRVYQIRQYGYSSEKRPSISNPKPIEPRFVYPESTTTQTQGASSKASSLRDRDVEKGSLTVSRDGTHPGRKLSWGQSPPATAPARAPDFPEARPVFRTINYNQPNETSPLTAPDRRGITSMRNAPPRLQLYGPEGRSPALVMDYGGTTPNPNGLPSATNMRFSQAPYPPTPFTQRPHRPSMAQVPYTAYGTIPNGHQSTFLGGYRSGYTSGVYGGYGAASSGVAAYDSRRSVMRVPMPGPASIHAGGYNSAYHTPLPSAMATPGGNSWKQEDTRQFYGQQLDFSAEKGPYVR
jgi:hypothetical protein